MKTAAAAKHLRRRRALLVTLACALMGSSGVLTAAERESRSAPDPLQLLRTRNIFDPNRRAGRSEEPRRETVAPPRVDVLSLTGTMLHGDRALAFFDGSQSGYREVVGVGGQIAGFSVTRIASASVELEGETDRQILGVGQSLRRTGDGPWVLSEETASPAARPTASAQPEASTSSATAPTPATLPAEASELMKRMMERRQREESQ